MAAFPLTADADITARALQQGWIVHAQSAFVLDPDVTVVDATTGSRQQAWRHARALRRRGRHVIVVDPTRRTPPRPHARVTVHVTHAWVDLAPARDRTGPRAWAARLTRIADRAMTDLMTGRTAARYPLYLYR